MKVLVIGSGGREHALAWKLSRETGVEEVICAPGNAGIAGLVRTVPVAATDLDGLIDLVRRERIDLTIVGPEAPLERGLADRFAAAGLPIFGPTQAAARLETSKSFAKAVMDRAQVPTARYRVATSPAEARAALDELGVRDADVDADTGGTSTGAGRSVGVALKADGLAAGKGVIVANTRSEALAAIDALMIDGKVGDAGRTLVVEERLEGPEVSCFAICDGLDAVPLLSAQDHKRIFDGDEGPNTGGMGAFAPSPLITPDLDVIVRDQIIGPVLRDMAAAGTPFRGFLYAGLMITADGPKVIEFNVRFGDPEAQVVLPMIDSDLAPLLLAAATGRLAEAAAAAPLRMSTQPHVGVVLASRGYPDSAEKGQAIDGLDAAATVDDVVVFHAGTRADGDRVLTDGGRVLTVVGRGPDYQTAIERAYAGVDRIRFDGMQHRRDIGKKALRS